MFGEPLCDEPSRMSHIRDREWVKEWAWGSPDVATCSANALINKVSIETFRCGIIPVLARLWSLACPCTASACEWLFHVLVVDPPGWFFTDGGQMWSCSQAPGAQGNMPFRQRAEKELSENVVPV
ncbi:hypothetical protein NQZ68_000369 [Dissostichus eleginoides]|nr:hypothetical protein NQZ68_000369 [Dissostichus eleginoides]